MAENKEPKPQKGCLFWGCLTVVVFAFLFCVLLGVTGFYLYRQVTTPLEIPQHEYVEADYERVQAELRGFTEEPDQDAAGDVSRPTRLELSQDDLNTLLLSALPKLPGRAYVSVEDDRLTLDASATWEEAFFPSTDIEDSPLDGLYINVSLALVPKMTGDTAGLEFDSFSVNGVPLPWAFIEGPLSEYLRDANGGGQNVNPIEKLDEVLKPFLDGAKSFEVVEDRLIIER